MSTIMIYNDVADFHLPDCETIWNYLSRFAKEDLEAGEIGLDAMAAMYDNLELLFGRMSRRERNAMSYNLEHYDGQLQGFKYSRNTKSWIAANMPTLERDEGFDSTEILTDLYSFYELYKFYWELLSLNRRYDIDVNTVFSVTTTDVI